MHVFPPVYVALAGATMIMVSAVSIPAAFIGWSLVLDAGNESLKKEGSKRTAIDKRT